MTESQLADTVRPIYQRFEQLYLGRTAREVHVSRCGELIFIHCHGILTDAESRLIQADSTTTGREMVEQMFRKMVRQSQDAFTGAVESTLSVTVGSLFCDLDSTTAEGIIVLAVRK